MATPCTRKTRLTKRQREVLSALARKDGQRQFWLAPSHSGNVLERMLAHDLIRVEVRTTGNFVFLTAKGREALRVGSYGEEKPIADALASYLPPEGATESFP